VFSATSADFSAVSAVQGFALRTLTYTRSHFNERFAEC